MHLLSLLIRLRNLALRTIIRAAHSGRTLEVQLERLGSEYGGWVVPAEHLNARSVCYCVGVGEDASFDLALIDRFGCHVYAFDPTPRAVQHVRLTAADNPAYHFNEIGVWSKDESVRFYSPRDPEHVSHSAVNLQGTSEYFEANCKRLGTIMRELGHERIDLLKLDVEGAEYTILDDMITNRVGVGVLCVEFDQPMPIAQLFGALRRLKAAGFRVANIEGWNYTFIHDSLGP